VCARLRGFGARVLFVDPVAPPPAFMEANRHVSAAASLSDMLLQCHFVLMCCDLNPSSKHILNSATLACMRPDAVLINAARGPLVDEAALVAALESGGIAGAAMDVFEHEPLAKDSPLLSMRNVVLAPHNANASPACHEAVHWSTIKSMLKALAIPFEEVLLKGA
jgi:D-3-phosphoglycerate dehydrogenase